MNPRALLVGWLGLIGLYTLVTHSDQVSTALGGAGVVLNRLGDPAYPLIPDSRTATPKVGAATTTGSNFVQTTPLRAELLRTAPSTLGVPPNYSQTVPTLPEQP